MKIKKNIQSIYQSNVWRKTRCLIIDKRREKKHYDFIKDFNRFINDYSLHRGRKYSCCFCSHAAITEEILKHRIKDCIKINGKQRIKIPKKGEYVKFKNFERKIKSPSRF